LSERLEFEWIRLEVEVQKAPMSKGNQFMLIASERSHITAETRQFSKRRFRYHRISLQQRAQVAPLTDGLVINACQR
jgi:hypothetical protein